MHDSAVGLPYMSIATDDMNEAYQASQNRSEYYSLYL